MDESERLFFGDTVFTFIDSIEDALSLLENY
jgi:hypothetical protein